MEIFKKEFHLNKRDPDLVSCRGQDAYRDEYQGSPRQMSLAPRIHAFLRKIWSFKSETITSEDTNYISQNIERTYEIITQDGEQN